MFLSVVICGLVAAVAAIVLVLQQRRALERVTDVLTSQRIEMEMPTHHHLVGHTTQKPSYIPPTDEVVWRPRIRRLHLEALTIEKHKRPEFELSL